MLFDLKAAIENGGILPLTHIWYFFFFISVNRPLYTLLTLQQLKNPFILFYFSLHRKASVLRKVTVVLSPELSFGTISFYEDAKYQVMWPSGGKLSITFYFSVFIAQGKLEIF